MRNPIGQVLINQYRVDDYIASGGMGTVYKVWDLKRNVPLAMKVLHADLASDPSVFKRFRREANALKKLAHPNIVPFYGLFQTENFTFLLEAYVDGPTLKTIIRQRDRKPFAHHEVLSYMKSICAALGYAHVHGVVHCDLKPGNVMIDRGGQVFLTDFGIARHAESTTTTLASAGTPAYMAPEQIRGEPVTPATDVYALGVLLYELLTGTRPFRGDEKDTENSGNTADERTRYAHLHLPPPDPKLLNLAISESLSQVVRKALAKEPDARYQNAQELYDALLSTTGVRNEQIEDRVVVPLASSASDPNFALPSEAYYTQPEPTINLLKKIPVWGWLIGGAIILILLMIIFFNTRLVIPVAALFPSKTPSPTSTLPPTVTFTPRPTLPPTSTTIPSKTPTITLTPSPTLVPEFDWLSEPIQTFQAVGYFTSMVIDKKDVIHLAYFQDNNDMTWYATNQTGEWIQSAVLGGQGSSMNLSLSLDSRGNPVIAYHVKQTKKNLPRLIFLQWNGTFWKGPFRNSAHEVADTDISMALDALDQPHFNFLDRYSNQVVYSKFSAAKGFEDQPLDNANPQCQSFPIAVDKLGNPHLLYQAADGGLMRATLKDGIWLREKIDPQPGAGNYSDIALDGQDNPHVVYYDSDLQNLKYAYLSSSGWNIQIVDHGIDVGRFPAIAIDQSGNIHISYYDGVNKDLKYAHGRPEGWNLYVVDSAGDVGQWNSIALDPNGLPRISYLDRGNEDLKLATAFRK